MSDGVKKKRVGKQWTSEEKLQHVVSRLAKLHRTQRFHVRAAINGVLYFVCPCCGHINVRQLTRKKYWVKCTHPPCQAKYIPKVNLLLIPGGGRRTIPPDFIIPDGGARGHATVREAFPAGDMEHWRQGQCVHTMTVVQMTADELRELGYGGEGDGNGDQDE